MERDLEALRAEIRRNVVETMAKPDYRRIFTRMSQQLNRESETFINLIRLVQETRRTVEASAMSGSDDRLLNVQRLEQQLYNVSQRHLALLNLQLDLNFLTEEALLASLRSTLIVRFHLEKELLAEVLRQNPPGEVVTCRLGCGPCCGPRPAGLSACSAFSGRRRCSAGIVSAHPKTSRAGLTRQWSRPSNSWSSSSIKRHSNCCSAFSR